MFVRKWIFLDTHFEGEWLLGQYFGSMKKLTFFYSFVYLSFEGIFFIFCLADENSFRNFEVYESDFFFKGFSLGFERPILFKKTLFIGSGGSASVFIANWKNTKNTPTKYVIKRYVDKKSYPSVSVFA
ncbi:hypothetical protein GLOIN_2v1470412 [Rhizophagus irregularis DAOM 181602=DAOM 197198]|uniref:Uncharacterized protein n=1 Tax=Rhizophagus irregularis (strain DAOM 181602 / DAOM 197198 / MUCL 43194) TaxID=747089 RepID=A0A2P4QWE8_RHIID|nr:hypothetical protein GLOIN_2v1470412 [Rhizophagus irregularis DAOM 181602=DAOM 197198]POG81868.1 hypothetical protein GLOIN_2v1470412 [Rhizophagus irregularis DAOM 181602=DAOM 197198]|eukprot:XP_025188734.1 hypothetical protein GLOIN_2v1470412 [Rhizophagus irregularis DAOM 181602=DAOM 197198]